MSDVQQHPTEGPPDLVGPVQERVDVESWAAREAVAIRLEAMVIQLRS